MSAIVARARRRGAWGGTSTRRKWRGDCVTFPPLRPFRRCTCVRVRRSRFMVINIGGGDYDNSIVGCDWLPRRVNWPAPGRTLLPRKACGAAGGCDATRNCGRGGLARRRTHSPLPLASTTTNPSFHYATTTTRIVLLQTTQQHILILIIICFPFDNNPLVSQRHTQQQFARTKHSCAQKTPGVERWLQSSGAGKVAPLFSLGSNGVEAAWCDVVNSVWRTDRAAGWANTIWLSGGRGRPRARLPSSPGTGRGLASFTTRTHAPPSAPTCTNTPLSSLAIFTPSAALRSRHKSPMIFFFYLNDIQTWSNARRLGLLAIFISARMIRLVTRTRRSQCVILVKLCMIRLCQRQVFQKFNMLLHT